MENTFLNIIYYFNLQYKAPNKEKMKAEKALKLSTFVHLNGMYIVNTNLEY